MSPVEVCDLDAPEAVVTYPLGATNQVRLAGMVVSRHVLQIDALAAIGVSIRVGIHSGEVALAGDGVWGVSVHVAARILAEAGSGEVLTSGTTRDLAEGAAGLAFEARGRYRLKGLEREHELFAAASSAKIA